MSGCSTRVQAAVSGPGEDLASGQQSGIEQCSVRLLSVVSLAILLLAPGLSRAQERVAIQADRVLDVVSGRLLRDRVVVIEGARIQSVSKEAPAGVKRVVLGDRTLLPGFVDTHTHLTYDLEGDWVHRPVEETPIDDALRGVRNARKTLLAGFTTVRDVGARGFADVGLQRAIDAGFFLGPRIVPSGHALSITGGHCDVTGFAPGILESGPEAGVADGIDQVMRAVRYQIKHGAKVVKVCATAGVLSFEGPMGAQQYSQEELDAVVAEASRHEVRVAAHAHGAEGILAAVRAGVASIEHGSMLTDETIALMKEKGIYLVPTTFLADAIDLEALPTPIRAKAEAVLPLARDSLRRAINAGVRIAYGTDAGVFPHGDNGKEFAVLVELGLSPLEAIRSATVNAADLLGLDDRGVIAPGKLADLIAVAGNPLTDIRTLEAVLFVMKGGEVVAQEGG